MVDINALPSEILQKCFRKVIEYYEDKLKDLFNGNLLEMEGLEPQRGQGADRSDLPNAKLMPISRTCKYWRNVVEPVLYSSITTRSHFKQLQEALSRKHRFNLVRKLRIIPLFNKRAPEEGELECIIGIIDSCPDIVHLELSGIVCDSFSTDKLFSAMRKSSLAHILLNVDFKKSPTNITLRNMSLYWPNLERIVLVRSDKSKAALTKSDMDKFAASKSLTRLRCIRISPSISYQQLYALSFLTSSSPLEHIELTITPNSTILPVLYGCIDHWAPTLRHFVIYLGRDGWETLPNIAKMIANLHDLVTLDCDSTYQILPKDMTHLTKLEKLIYKVNSLDVLKSLTKTITSGLLPSLNSIDINTEISGQKSAYKETVASLRSACVARGFKHYLITDFHTLHTQLLAEYYHSLFTGGL